MISEAINTFSTHRLVNSQQCIITEWRSRLRRLENENYI